MYVYTYIYICISIHTVALVFKPTYKLQLQVVFLVTIKHDGSSITHGDLQRTYDWCLFVNLNFILVCVHVNIWEYDSGEKNTLLVSHFLTWELKISQGRWNCCRLQRWHSSGYEARVQRCAVQNDWFISCKTLSINGWWLGVPPFQETSICMYV